MQSKYDENKHDYVHSVPVFLFFTRNKSENANYPAYFVMWEVCEEKVISASGIREHACE